MLDIIIKLAPIFFFIALGRILKKTGFANRDHGDFLLKFVFFVTLPAMVLLKLPQVPLPPDKAFLPLISITVNLGCLLAVWLATLRLPLEATTRGVMMVGVMVINSVFMYPFILAGFGDAGFADAILFDFGNAVMTATVTYLIAFRYGADRRTSCTMLARLARSPMSWALAAAVAMNIASITLPALIARCLEPIGQMTSPLILISLGIFFAPKWAGLKPAVLTVVIRMGLGPVLGVSIAALAGLEGTTFWVVSLCCAAPVGFVTLTFASLAELNTEFASSVLSLSIFVGIVYIPLLMYLIQCFNGP
jgi:predicted permease